MKTYTFDSTNPYWDKNFDFDMLFLHAKQNYFNDKLQADGFVLFSDVLTQLGFPVDDSISDDWKWDLNNNDDDRYVDFGIKRVPNEGTFDLNFNIRDQGGV